MSRAKGVREVTVGDLLCFDQQMLEEFFGNIIQTTEEFAQLVLKNAPSHHRMGNVEQHLQGARTLLQEQKYFQINLECAKALLAMFDVSKERIEWCEQEAQRVAQKVLQNIQQKGISVTDEGRILQVVAQDVIVVFPRAMVEGLIDDLESYQFPSSAVLQMEWQYTDQIVEALKRN